MMAKPSLKITHSKCAKITSGKMYAVTNITLNLLLTTSSNWMELLAEKGDVTFAQSISKGSGASMHVHLASLIFSK